MNFENYDELSATLKGKMDEVAKDRMKNMVDDFYDKEKMKDKAEDNEEETSK